MKKINDFINKYISNIFIINLILCPFIDCLVGIFNDNKYIMLLNYILKVLFIFIESYYIVLNNKKNFKYLLLLAIYLSIFFLINGDVDNFNLFKQELNMTFKSIYFALTILFSIIFITKNNFDNKFLLYTLYIYLVLIFIPDILNIGFNSYAHSKEGSAGFFYSANAIGNIISMIFPIFMSYIISNPKNKILYLFVLIYIYVILNIGTKAPIMFTILVLIYYLILLIIKNKSEKKKLMIIFLLSIGLVLFMIFIFPLTPFYNNIVVHLNYLKIKKLSDLTNVKKFDNFIFGDRLKFLSNSLTEYAKSSFVSKFFGIGYIIENIKVKLSEMDLFVILVHQGICGLLLVMGVYIKRVFEVIIKFIGNFKVIFINYKKMSLILSIIISFLSMCFIGHVVDSPSCSIVLSIILGLSIKEIK